VSCYIHVLSEIGCFELTYTSDRVGAGRIGIWKNNLIAEKVCVRSLLSLITAKKPTSISRSLRNGDESPYGTTKTYKTGKSQTFRNRADRKRSAQL